MPGEKRRKTAESRDSAPIRKKTIDLQNEQFRLFSETHDNIFFFNTISLLDSYPESEVFSDQCCHLSDKGSEIVAQSLLNLVVGSDD